MAESIFIPEAASRADIYEALLPQIASIIEHESNRTANLANVAAVLKEAFGFFWVGFYMRDETDLVLGPFQGPLACTRIAFSKGVCGHAYSIQKSVLVPDVDQFPGHIACSSASKSEVVVPIFSPSGEIVGVLDVDSDRLNDFSEIDVIGLEKIMHVLSTIFN